MYLINVIYGIVYLKSMQLDWLYFTLNRVISFKNAVSNEFVVIII
jgi:hypothetical protein